MMNEIGLAPEDLQKIFYANAKRFFALPDRPAERKPALV